MKRIWLLLVGIILGGLLGWAFGYLRVPYFDQRHAFGVGLTTGIALALVVFTFRIVWTSQDALFSIFSKKQSSSPPSPLTVFLALCLLLSLIVGGILISGQHVRTKQRISALEEALETQIISTGKARAANQFSQLDSLLAMVDREAASGLSDELISRFANLSEYLKPYTYSSDDSMSNVMLSPERGQLLLALLTKDIDSASFLRLKKQVSFAYAELESAELSGADLSGADLRGANFRDAILTEANLSSTDLRGANLWGAHLDKANLQYANMKRANLSWASLNEAILADALLDGVTMLNAKLFKADLRRFKAEYADCSGSMFNDANIEDGDFLRSKLHKTNFTGANLKNCMLYETDLESGILTDAAMYNTIVDDVWLEALKKKKVTGANAVKARYETTHDTLNKSYLHRFCLKEKE